MNNSESNQIIADNSKINEDNKRDNQNQINEYNSNDNNNKN
jgi:hypothetical protein